VAKKEENKFIDPPAEPSFFALPSLFSFRLEIAKISSNLLFMARLLFCGPNFIIRENKKVTRKKHNRGEASPRPGSILSTRAKMSILSNPLNIIE